MIPNLPPSILALPAAAPDVRARVVHQLETPSLFPDGLCVSHFSDSSPPFIMLVLAWGHPAQADGLNCLDRHQTPIIVYLVFV